MKKAEIAKRIARRTGVTQAEAADSLDRMVHDILARLRRGSEAQLGSIGVFRNGPGGTIEFFRTRSAALKHD